VLVTARAYADDRTLINYCIRYANEMRPFLYSVVQGHIEEALVKLRAAGADHQQRAELVQAVLANVRFFPADAKDAALEKRCVSEEVERNYAQFGLISFSLAQRGPSGRWRVSASMLRPDSRARLMARALGSGSRDVARPGLAMVPILRREVRQG
jgi:hypothetical protein